MHPFIEQPFRRLDIFRLATLVPTAQENHDPIALRVTVDAITRAIMNAQFADPLPGRAGKKFSDALPRPAAAGIFPRAWCRCHRSRCRPVKAATLSKRTSHTGRGPCRGANAGGGAGATAEGDRAGRAGGAGASGRVEGHRRPRWRVRRTHCTRAPRTAHAAGAPKPHAPFPPAGLAAPAPVPAPGPCRGAHAVPARCAHEIAPPEPHAPESPRTAHDARVPKPHAPFPPAGLAAAAPTPAPDPRGSHTPSRADARTKSHRQSPMHQRPPAPRTTPARQDPMHHFRPPASPPRRPRQPRVRAAAHTPSRPDARTKPHRQSPMHQSPPAPRTMHARQNPMHQKRAADGRGAASGMAAAVTHGNAPKADSTQDHRLCSPA
jgi:hypothetical protein